MTKKQIVCLSILALLITVAANAQQGGYRGPGVGAITVEESRNLRDGSSVVLQGKIERFLGTEKFVFPKYLFTDNSGSITILIFDGVWGDLSIDHNDIVEITGIIQRQFTDAEIIVRSIRFIQRG